MKTASVIAIAFKYFLYAVGAAIALWMLRAVQENDLWGVLRPLRGGLLEGSLQILAYYGLVLAAIVFAFEIYPPTRTKHDE